MLLDTQRFTQLPHSIFTRVYKTPQLSSTFASFRTSSLQKPIIVLLMAAGLPHFFQAHSLPTPLRPPSYKKPAFSTHKLLSTNENIAQYYRLSIYGQWVSTENFKVELMYRSKDYVYLNHVLITSRTYCTKRRRYFYFRLRNSGKSKEYRQDNSRKPGLVSS